MTIGEGGGPVERSADWASGWASDQLHSLAAQYQRGETREGFRILLETYTNGELRALQVALENTPEGEFAATMRSGEPMDEEGRVASLALRMIEGILEKRAE